MPGAISVDLVPDINSGEWQAAMQALAAQAAQSMAVAGALAGQAFQEGFAVGAIGPGGAAELFRGPGGRFVSPRALGPGLRAAHALNPAPTVLPSSGGVFRAPAVGALEGSQFTTASNRYRNPATGRLTSYAGALAAGGVPRSTVYDASGIYRGPSPYGLAGAGGAFGGTRSPNFNYDFDPGYEAGAGNLARYDPTFATAQEARYAAQQAASRIRYRQASDGYFDSLNRLQAQGYDLTSGETEEEFLNRRRAERESRVSEARTRARSRFNPFRRGGVLGGSDVDASGRGGYASNRRQVRLGDALLGSATGLPGQLRNTALGLGFTARFGGVAGLAGLGAGVGVGVSGLIYNRFRTGPGGLNQVGDNRANAAFNDLTEGLGDIANTLATQFGPALTEAVEGLASFASGLNSLFAGAGDAFDSGQGSLSGFFGLEGRLRGVESSGFLGRLQTSQPAGRLLSYLGINRTDNSNYGNYNTARAQGFNAQTLPDRPVSTGVLGGGASSRTISLLNSRYLLATQDQLAATEQQYTGLLSERLQIERALTDQMHAELNARLNLTQHLATEALDIPNERLTLNEAIANLRNSAGQQALTHGTTAQRNALRGVLDVAGAFSGLEGQSLTALNAAARRSGESQRNYIRNFVQETTGFSLSSSHLDLIQQQIGAAGAREQQEDLGLRREQLSLTRTNNDNLASLNGNVEALAEVMSELAIHDGVGGGVAGHLNAEYEFPSPLFADQLILEGITSGRSVVPLLETTPPGRGHPGGTN